MIVPQLPAASHWRNMRQFITCSFHFTLLVPRKGTEPGQSSCPTANQDRPFPPLCAAVTSGSVRNRRANIEKEKPKQR